MKMEEEEGGEMNGCRIEMESRYDYLHKPRRDGGGGGNVCVCGGVN